MIVSTVEVRDPCMAGHPIRTANLAVAITEEMGLYPNIIEGIKISSLIHYVSKLAIPTEILTKSTKVSMLDQGGSFI